MFSNSYDLRKCANCHQPQLLGCTFKNRETLKGKLETTDIKLNVMTVGFCSKKCFKEYHEAGIAMNGEEVIYHQGDSKDGDLYLSLLTRIFNQVKLRAMMYCSYRLLELDHGCGILVLHYQDKMQLIKFLRDGVMGVDPKYCTMSTFYEQCNLQGEKIPILDIPTLCSRKFLIYILIGTYHFLVPCEVSPGNDYFLLSTNNITSAVLQKHLRNEKYYNDPYLEALIEGSMEHSSYINCASILDPKTNKYKLNIYIFTGNLSKEALRGLIDSKHLLCSKLYRTVDRHLGEENKAPESVQHRDVLLRYQS